MRIGAFAALVLTLGIAAPASAGHGQHAHHLHKLGVVAAPPAAQMLTGVDLGRARTALVPAPVLAAPLVLAAYPVQTVAQVIGQPLTVGVPVSAVAVPAVPLATVALARPAVVAPVVSFGRGPAPIMLSQYVTVP